MIPIFDSNSHLAESTDSINLYLGEMDKQNICGCIVTLLPPHPLSFYYTSLNIVKRKNIHVVPYFDGNNLEELKRIYKDCAFKGIKIHPRFSGLDINDEERFNELFAFATESDVFIMLCTYYHSPTNYPVNDPLFTIARIVNKYPRMKLILLHGGDVRLVEFAQFARHQENVFIDLSHTLTRYNSTFIDSQVSFCMQELDQKCIIGSDFPYLTLEALRTKADQLTDKLEKIKVENIYYKNIQKILKHGN